MPLDTFHCSAKQILASLLAVQNNLVPAYQSLEDLKDLCQERCQDMLFIVQLLQEPINDLCQLIGNIAELPKAVVSLRYPLEVSAYYAAKQIKDLIQNLEHFSPGNRPSLKKERQQQEILRAFKVILQTYDEILQKIPDLIDQSYFREHRHDKKQSRRRKSNLTVSATITPFPRSVSSHGRNQASSCKPWT